MKKIGIFFGGPGNEHDISISSARNIFKNIDLKKYELVLAYWDKNGKFYFVDSVNFFNKVRKIKEINIEKFSKYFEIALLMTHGKYGEDGVLQGILESQKIKYCGCRVLSSALCMDKAVFKTYMEGNKIRQTKFKVIDFNLMNNNEISSVISEVKKELRLPFYVKPANSGSSIGVTKMESLKKLESAIEEATKHDQKVIIEEGLVGHREIEVAVLGNKELTISSPGELKASKDFYDYDEKYNLGKTEVIIPAKISSVKIKEMKKIAERVYRLCACSGFARIDFFLLDDKVYVNEVNTLPGFTDISMYPMLMKARGIEYKKLISEIINLAY